MTRMRRAFFASMALAAALPAACVTLPATVQERTLDEQAALSVELAYQASATVMLTAHRTGRLPPASRDRLRALDRQAYRAVVAARLAYDAGNADDYQSAVKAARGAVSVFLAEAAK